MISALEMTTTAARAIFHEPAVASGSSRAGGEVAGGLGSRGGEETAQVVHDGCDLDGRWTS